MQCMDVDRITYAVCGQEFDVLDTTHIKGRESIQCKDFELLTHDRVTRKRKFTQREAYGSFNVYDFPKSVLELTPSVMEST